MILMKLLKMVTIEAAGKDVAVVQWLEWLYRSAENTVQLALGLGNQSQPVA
jgi:hypothetical protein